MGPRPTLLPKLWPGIIAFFHEKRQVMTGMAGALPTITKSPETGAFASNRVVAGAGFEPTTFGL